MKVVIWVINILSPTINGGKSILYRTRTCGFILYRKTFLDHLLGGIQYALDRKSLDYTKAYTIGIPDEDRFEKNVLGINLDEPMEMDIMKDGSVSSLSVKAISNSTIPRPGSWNM